MRYIKLNELGKSSKPTERFLEEYVSNLINELEVVMAKLCDLKAINISFKTANDLGTKALTQGVTHPEIGSLVFSVDKESIESILCLHLKIESTASDSISLTATHSRLFERLSKNFATVLLGNGSSPTNVEMISATEQHLSFGVFHGEKEVASFGVTLDTRTLSHVRDMLGAFPEVNAERVEKGLMQVPVDLDCEVMKTTTSLQQMLSLQTGDFLPMPKQKHTNVLINGVQVYSGTLTSIDNQLGVKINE